jgi:hypothetical protein
MKPFATADFERRRARSRATLASCGHAAGWCAPGTMVRARAVQIGEVAQMVLRPMARGGRAFVVDLHLALDARPR